MKKVISRTTVRFCLLTAIAVSVAHSRAAITKIWEQTYDGLPGGSTLDRASEVFRVAGGDIIVAGTLTDYGGPGDDILVIKYSGANGEQLWSRRFNNPDYSDDTLVAAAADPQGNVFVTASSLRLASRSDFYTAKYAAADGALLWERYFTGPGVDDDSPTALAVDPVGNIFVAGHSFNGSNDDLYVAKYSGTNGAILWEHRYSSPENDNDYARAITVDAGGNLVLTGSSAFRFYTAKYAAGDGDLLWERRDGGPGIGLLEGEKIVLDSQGDVFVSGRSFESSYNVYTAKYSGADGSLRWAKHFDGAPYMSIVNEAPSSIAVDPVDNLIVAVGSRPDIVLLKYSGADGSIDWQTRFTNGAPNDIAIDALGDVFVTGYRNGADFVARLSGSGGSVLWEAWNTFGGFGQSILLDGDQHLVVAGAAPDVDTVAREDLYVGKFTSGNGQPVWQKTYNGIRSSSDFGMLSAINSSGDVFVHGNSQLHYTAKHQASNGQTLWQKLDDRLVMDMTVTPSGDLAITGYTSHTNEFVSRQMVVALRSGNTGEILWEKNLAMDTNTNSRGWAIATDTNGNVIASGSYGNLANEDIYTAKYRHSDGQLLWERRHISSGDDRPFEIVLDQKQDVFIVGYLDRQFFVTKYSGTDGTLLWEQQRPIRWDWIGLSYHAAVDANGDVIVVGGSWTIRNVAKFSGSTGRLLWETPYSTTPLMQAGVRQIALDSAGNPIIGGYSASQTPDADVFFFKLSAMDGSLLWENRLTNHFLIRHPGMYVDEADDIVAGVTFRAGRGPDVPQAFSALKLSGESGTVLSELKQPLFQGYHMAVRHDGLLAVTGGQFGDLTTILLRNGPRARVIARRDGLVLTLQWPETFKGFQLQSLSTENGISPNPPWTTVAESSTTNIVNLPIDPQSKSGFFRLVQ